MWYHFSHICDPGDWHVTAVFEIFEGFHFIERGYIDENHFVFDSSETVLIDTENGRSAWWRYFERNTSISDAPVRSRTAMFSPLESTSSAVSTRRDTRRTGLSSITWARRFSCPHAGKRPERFIFDHLMKTVLFRETVDFYFEGKYRKVYRAVMGGFLERCIVVESDGLLSTTVRS